MLQRLMKFLTTLTIAAAISLASWSRAANVDPSIADQVKSIKDEYEQKDHAARVAWHDTKDENEAARLYFEKRPDAAVCVDRLIKIVKSDPKNPASFDALALAIACLDTGQWKDPSDEPWETVLNLAVTYVIDNPRLAETFEYLDASSVCRKFIRTAIDKSTNRVVRAWAVYYLAKSLRDQADQIENYREIPGMRPIVEKSAGKAWVAEQTKPDPKQLHAESIALLQRARQEFADVIVYDESIGDRAQHMIFELQHLGIGQTAPEIIGKDQDGREMKLSDYRGKVVALVFWGGWCSVCMGQAKHEGQLVTRMQGKPFVLLGVNSDPINKLPGIIAKHEINWRSWADGDLDGPRPISRTWNVMPWPKVYLIDANGVIRYTELARPISGNELADAVDKLLAELPATRS